MSTKTREIYVCSACGDTVAQWRGQCPNCKEWNTLEARTVSKAQAKRSCSTPLVSTQSTIVPLKDVQEDEHEPFGTGMAELDRILGAGLVPGAALLIGGEPGIGKSTLLLQVAAAVASSQRTVLYVSGEESLGQLRSRAARLMPYLMS